MTLPPAVADHYRSQQRLTVKTLGETRAVWAAMGRDFDSSWRKVGPRLVLLTSSAQLGAARAGAAYVPVALEQQDTTARPEAKLDPRGLVGRASDGRSLDGLLYSAVTTAKQGVGAGMPVDLALAAGGKALDAYIHTMVADAGRGAASVEIAARPKVGWVRMVNPPCCSRCAILAGKWFKWNQGFQRHPRCDCRHIPAAESLADDVSVDPVALFKSGQVTGLKPNELAAIRDGSDPSQVINARRGSSGMTTTESTTRRGRATRGRLTPDGIYASASSREEALALLSSNGYLL